jgi:hypothetical protein
MPMVHRETASLKLRKYYKETRETRNFWPISKLNVDARQKGHITMPSSKGSGDAKVYESCAGDVLHLCKEVGDSDRVRL